MLMPIAIKGIYRHETWL